MHAGTPSAEGAHIALCAALSLVMFIARAREVLTRKTRATSERARDARLGAGALYVYFASYVALSTKRAIEFAPGTSKHVAFVAFPLFCAFVKAKRARFGRAEVALACAALAARANKGGKRVMMVVASASACALWRVREERTNAGVTLAFIVLGVIARGDGEDVYFARWAGTIAIECACACVVKFVALDGRGKGKENISEASRERGEKKKRA